VKSFITLGPEHNVIKLFWPVIYRFVYLARVFVRLDWKSLPMTKTKIRNLRTKTFYNIGPRLERLVRDKHSSVVVRSISDKEKKKVL
jgi:hypothetical protein